MPEPETTRPAAPVPRAHSHPATLKRLEQSSGSLAAQAIARMDETLPWYRAMPPENRSWIGLVAQAGIAAFTEWFRHPDAPQAISTDVFGTAPRELTRAITLRQTVEMVRTTIEVMESAIDEVAAPGDESVLREALLVYAREIAFATAQVYAQAAEARGAWDARLESLVVNAVLSGEADEGAVSRAAALGWNSPEHVCVVLGTAPDGDSELTVEAIRRAARHAKLQVLTGVLGDRLVVIAGGSDNPLAVAKSLIGPYAAGPVVAGPIVPDLLAATRSAQAAAAGLKACSAWQDAPARYWRTICFRNARWPVTQARATSWWRRSTDRWRRPGPRSWRRSVSIWSRRVASKVPRGCCSSIPTPCATGFDV